MKGFTEVAPEELIVNDFIQNCRSEEDEADVSDRRIYGTQETVQMNKIGTK